MPTVNDNTIKQWLVTLYVMVSLTYACRHVKRMSFWLLELMLGHTLSRELELEDKYGVVLAPMFPVGILSWPMLFEQ